MAAFSQGCAAPDLSVLAEPVTRDECGSQRRFRSRECRCKSVGEWSRCAAPAESETHDSSISRLGTRCSEKRKACTRGTRSCRKLISRAVPARMLFLSAGETTSVLTGHRALRFGTSMCGLCRAVSVWSCVTMAVASTLSWLCRSRYVALVAPSFTHTLSLMCTRKWTRMVRRKSAIHTSWEPFSKNQQNSPVWTAERCAVSCAM